MTIKLFRFFVEMSLLKESTANFAGDGPKFTFNGSEMNGIQIVKINSDYYISAVDSTINYIPQHAVHVGDKIIQINQLYCEQINVFKYVNNNIIKQMKLKTSAGIEHEVNRGNINTENTTTSNTLQSTAHKTRPYRQSSLVLNGIQVVKKNMHYYISNRDATIVQYTPANCPHIGDRIIKIDQRYCELIGNVCKYIETHLVSQMLLKAISGEEYIATRIQNMEQVNNIKLQNEQIHSNEDTINGSILEMQTCSKLDKRIEHEVNRGNINTENTTTSNTLQSTAHKTRPYRQSSLVLNGIQVVKKNMHYYISNRDATIVQYTPANCPHIGDRIIKIDQRYCELIGNVCKYIETHLVSQMLLKAISGEEYIATRNQTVEPCSTSKGGYYETPSDQIYYDHDTMNSDTRKKRNLDKEQSSTGSTKKICLQINEKTASSNMYTENIQSPSMHSSLKLNGIKLRQEYSEYFVDEVDENIFLKLFPKSNVSIGDRVITINNDNVSILGNVLLHTDIVEIKHMVLINQLNQMYEIARVSSNVYYSNTNVMNATIHGTKKKVKYNNSAYAAQHMETCYASKNNNIRQINTALTSNQGQDSRDIESHLQESARNCVDCNRSRETIRTNTGNNPLLLTVTRNISRRRFQSLELSWNYEDPCQYCKYVHLSGATKGQKSKCCINGAALRAPFPQLRQLPEKILHYARDRILHMSRNSVSYNTVLSCAATAVENDEGGGFEVIHGNHAVKLHGRTYHYLTSTSGQGGIQYFTFDRMANCVQYATSTLNNVERGYERIIAPYLENIFKELQEYNIICQECEQIGYYAKDYVHNEETRDLIATINERTSFLDVAQITSDAATGNRIITFLRKGSRKTKSIKPPDKMWEPFLYPLLFFHGERGWGDDIRKQVEFTDYLIARLLCPEKIVEDGVLKFLEVPNLQFDTFLAPIITHIRHEPNVNKDDMYRHYAKTVGDILQSHNNYSEAIKIVLQFLCTNLQNFTKIESYVHFFNELHHKLDVESLQDIATFISSSLLLRRQQALPEENIESSLTHIVMYHSSMKLKKGRMALLKVNRFQLMSRLSQIYLVDSVSRAIDYRLRFHRMHQQDIFGIQPSTAEQQGTTGKKTFLSQSMHGSTRHLRALARNALALVSEYGRPSLFITLTCNPNWPEIIEQLLPGQTAFDRGDVVCQVFHRKLQALLANLRQGKYFPVINSITNWHKIEYEVRVIEYQRRGLPHAHIVLRFENTIEMPVYENKEELAKWIDSHITAKYPKTANDQDPLELDEEYEYDLEYSDIVKTHMLHKCISETNGGCLNEANVCAKGYNKNVVSVETTFDHKGFPQYKRPTIKSLNVVPHNRLLLKDWNGHANVEFAGSTYTVIYLYKYLFKGNKKVKMRLNNVRKDDEISLYLRGRYLCSMDCYWRILGHETYPASSPAVKIIKVISDQSASSLINENKVTDLIIYFNRPECLHNLKYAELFNVYIWSYEKPKRNIYERNEIYTLRIEGIEKVIYLYKKLSNKKSITRLEIVSITAGELFYLRLILYNFSRTSFSDCKRFARISYSTYQEAAVASGIVKDKNEILTCFEEAARFQFNTPAELRSLFVMATIQGFPTLKILQEQRFKELLYTDYYHNYEEENPAAAWNDLLKDLCARFESEGKNMLDYGLPVPKDMKTELEVERLKYDPVIQRQIYLSLCRQTPNTAEQQQIFDEITYSIRHGHTKLYYIQGQAGSGKSTLARKLMAWSRSNGKICAGCASTGLAATIYDGFETAHSLFKFPVVEDDEREVDVPIECQLQHHKNRYEFLKATNFILWDEFPSCDREVFEAAYKALDGFKNKVVVTMGDMRQIAPVVVTGEREDIINHSIPSSPLWKWFTKKFLTINMRLYQTTDENSNIATGSDQAQLQKKYGEMILAIGNGTHIPNTFKEGYVNDRIKGSTTVELEQCRAILNIDDAIAFVFPQPFNPDIFSRRAILCGTNDAVDEWNSRIQELNPNILLEPLASHDQLTESDDPHNILKQMLTDDVLNNFNNNGVPPHLLQLKVNDICIVLRNLNKKEGLTNNTRVRILNITPKCIRIQTLTSNKKSFSIPRIRFKFRLPFGRSFQLLRTQFPLRLAYCMTINKSQGQEFERCLLDIRSPPFSHGHLYVALSRIRDYRHIAIFTNENNVYDEIVTTENIVYPELLLL